MRKRKTPVDKTRRFAIIVTVIGLSLAVSGFIWGMTIQDEIDKNNREIELRTQIINRLSQPDSTAYETNFLNHGKPNL